MIYIGVMSGKSLFLPEKASDEVLNTYIDTIKKIMKQPDFQKVAKKELGGYDQTFGKEAAAALKGAIDVDPETRAWIAKFLKRKFDFNMM
jgi:tripartite-type tricarboxylate transporter receptor subunit TctC